VTLDVNYEEAQNISIRAMEVARSYSHEMVTLEHVLYALLENNEVQTCLASLSVNYLQISELLEKFFSAGFIGKSKHGGTPIKTAHFEALFVRAIATSQFSSRKNVTAVDLLMFMMQFPHEDNYAVTALLRANVTSLALKKYLARNTPATQNNSRVDRSAESTGPMGDMPISDSEPTNHDEAIAYVKKFATNLNELADSGKIDPVIGRASEFDSTIQVLARRTKNNAVLVGDPGCGKTAIAEGLAYNIVKGNVPKILRNSTVWSLDIGALVAGTRFRGDFEERMKIFLKSLTFLSEPLPEHDPESPTIAILFIDEIHMIIEAGSGNKGTMDVSNLLKPALAKGTLRCIGSTTLEEWRKHFEKDRALVRRFKKIQIDEPSPELTKAILRGLRGIYEAFHHVTYTDAALDASVDLTHRYIKSAVLPDKAIDIMDQAGARQRITDENKLIQIDVKEIEVEVSKIAKIPPAEMSEAESDKLARLQKDLENAVFGQSKAIEALTNAVMISRSGLRESNLPAGCYLFSGPTGCGKTEVARQFAKTLGIPLVKFDMSEYMEKHSVSKLIGSPPGYVGFGDGGAGDGLLVNAVDTNPACVLLLDEIEKAHPDIYGILLQVMDDAKLTNSQGKTVYFHNVYVIMTTNAGVAATETNVIGFGRESDIGEIDEKAIKNTFTPEFRNRLDAVISFDRLKPEVMLKIVDKFINNLKVLASLKNVDLTITIPACEWLANKGYDKLYGARPLTRVIDKYIKIPLSKEMLFGFLKNGGKASIHLEKDKLVIRF